MVRREGDGLRAALPQRGQDAGRWQRYATRGALAAALLVVGPTTMAVGAACGEELPAAPAADASDDAASDDASPPDGASAACVPEPMGSVDAGPEDAACGSNGGSVDLLTSDNHCGFCGNVCAPTTCKQGSCSGVVVATGGELNLVSGAATTTHLYFSTNAAACGDGAIRRLSLTGEPPTVETVLTESGGCITWTAIRGDRLYYLHPATGIHETSVSTPQPKEGVIVASANVYGAHLTKDHLIWQGGEEAIRVVPLDGGASQTIHEDTTTNRIIVFAGEGEAAWWVTAPRSATGPQEETLRTRTVGAGDTSTFVTGKVGINRLAFDATHVYFATVVGEVYRLRKDTPGVPELVTKIDTTPSFPRSLNIVGDDVFVAIGDPGNPSNGLFELYRANKCGGRARMIARDYLYGAGLTPFGDYFYYGRIAELARLQIAKR